MRRTIVCILLLTLVTVPPSVVADDPEGTDLNTLLFDNVWPLVGPGGPGADTIADALDAVGLKAARVGGALDASTTHHGEATHTLTGFVCSDADVQMSSPNPFFHSDLENGIFEATGSFFVDVDITGADAADVAEVWFGFAHTFVWPVSSALCAGVFPVPGAYYEFYRGDQDGSDGWEIPVNTLLVPDMAYGAVLRAQDADGNVLAATFVYANVNNYLDDTDWQPGTPVLCDQDSTTGELLCPYHDVTPPFPSVEGALGHARTGTTATACPDGIALEYGEPLTSFSVSSGNKADYTPDPRDDDPAPLTFNIGTDVWGPAYCVTNAASPLTVTAVDQDGNVGKRTITF